MGQVFGRGVKTPLRASLLVATAGMAIAAMPVAAQAAPPSCKSITKGTLDVELPAGQRSSRMVRLAEGETVNFSIHSGASGATVTLVSGGAPQTLLAPNAGGMASFCAPSTATYVFVIEAGRENLTSVSANCTAAGGSTAASMASRQEMDLAQLDTDTEGLSRRSAFSLGLAEIAAATRAARSPISQWIGDEATVISAIDTAAGDDDAAGAVSLSLSTNSEVDPEEVEGVLARMHRTTGTDAAADTETQTAMSWSAILAPGLSFAPAPQTVATVKRPVRKTTEVATADATPAAADWWVTHLQDNRESASATETAVTRRDSIASNAFPTPPMALGAFIPPDDQLPAAAAAAAR